MSRSRDVLAGFHEPVRAWFNASFGAPTLAQQKGWPPILEGKSTLLLAPTGSGKTLAAFLSAIDRLMFSPEPPKKERCRVLYISPLKALGADVEKNLRAPVAGIDVAATREGVAHRLPVVAVRSGDTPASERVRIGKHPPDILITTPESLYLLLTSSAREIVQSVETVILDEIHSLVSTKRGAHLSLSLERLESLRLDRSRPLQRIGLSATQRPLEEVARMLGGGEIEPSGVAHPRPVEIIDAGTRKSWELVVEVPVEDMSKLGEPVEMASGPAAAGPARRSIWPSIHPRLVELIRAHRSTMIFANSRRLSERLAAAINEVAGEEIALAHHGSLARDKRLEIEERLKAGQLPAIIATSSLELGLDLGAVDLVVQIEAPPSIASGIQRIGRAGHSVGATSRGVIFPKYRGDLLASAAATAKMVKGEVEPTTYLRNPLDVLAQQIVAIVSMEPVDVEDLYGLVRRSACFAELPRGSFEGVLDMLSGRYPSDEFAELRPRITWDRTAGRLRARDGARRIAVVSGGTIPDRGLYGVYLAGEREGKGSRRVGELDEEMVFESRTGDVFLLGASSWRIEEITHDRVLVSPAPGQPGKMPFWHGDRPGRPVELGRAIGALTRTLAAAPRDEAMKRLRTEHGLDERAADNLCAYLAEQVQATGDVPSDRTLIVERYIDEIGTFCVCLLSPFGARVHAPWSQAVLARLNTDRDQKAEAIWSDDGIVFRMPESEDTPEASLFLPAPDDVEDLLVRSLGGTSLFAARFRENAARALLLPRKRPGERTPLWAQRKRAADLLAVASRFGSFPILLETYRECLRDVFDMPALVELLRQIQSRRLRVRTVDSRAPSPFAASLLFSYVANFIYDGDAPLAERRAQALSVDPAQLRELLGEAELRELLDPEAIAETEMGLQRLGGKRAAHSPDSLHDMLLSLGDLSREEIRARSVAVADSESPGGAVSGAERGSGGGGERGSGSASDAWADELVRSHRAVETRIGGDLRLFAAEDIARYRDALGIVPPRGAPKAFLEPVADPLGDLVSRYARTHGPFLVETVAARLGLGVGPVRDTLKRLSAADRVMEGEFLPGGKTREWCDTDVLRTIKRRSLARLRREIEPVEQPALARFLLDWQNVRRPRVGVDALLSAIEQLEGMPLSASSLESEILPARVERFRPADLDLLCAAGEVVWAGIEPLGPSDGRIALYLTDRLRLLAPPPRKLESELAARVRTLLLTRGALFFSDLPALTGAFPKDLLTALWDLVWSGEATNDTLAPLRSFLRGDEAETASRRAVRTRGFRSRRAGPPGSEGRWSLLPHVRDRLFAEMENLSHSRFIAPGSPPTSVPVAASGGPPPAAIPGGAGGARDGAIVGGERGGGFGPSETERRAALARSLLTRYGVVTREAVHAEGIEGGFSAVYDVFKAMEEAGRVRRGYFVAGLGATQFAAPGAEDRLRSMRERPETPHLAVLAATDPANPYGAALPWPERTGARPGRAAGALVILHDGELIGYLGRAERSVLSFLPGEEPDRSQRALALATALASLVEQGKRRTLLIAQVDGEPTDKTPLAPHLVKVGFVATSKGYFKRGVAPRAIAIREP
ncbi:MAG: DEAD/DEAH box helicase [Polyangiaceae bacterium]